MNSELTALLIAGPTASGKSDLALKLAQELEGVIVNADSMQVYRDLRILTARPGDDELKRVPHMLYGHVDGAMAYSSGKWLEDVKGAMARIRAENKLPVIVGGTGLYFKALTQGLAAIPDISPEIRDKWRQHLHQDGPDTLHRKLHELDPVLAVRVSPKDGQRIIRGLEVLEQTGKTLSAWQQQANMSPLLQLDTTYPLLMDMTREEIYRRCDERVDLMMKEGAVEEVERLQARQLDKMLPVMKVIGVPQLLQHLEGEICLEAAIEKIKTVTRRYAKRQFTWLKSNMIAWKAVSTQDSESILLDIMPKLRKNG